MKDNNIITMLKTNLIVPNKYQPRKVFDETSLNNLANSIKNYGIINPILVRQKDNKYEIIAGERRFRAAKIVGLTEIPVIIKNADEQQMAELALIENLERQNLNPIEEAKSYEEIMRIGNQTQVSLANKLNKSQSSIANKIRLLSLPQEIQDALSHRKISERHARSLLSVADKERQLELLNQIITEKLTVKETEQIINEKEINEDEIRQAINDIMKSLNIEDEEEDKKEKKEDDNMNNGNFFPNFDNNNVANNNASLNMMNMQSMNQTPISPEPEMVMPTVNQPVTMEPTPMVNLDPMMSQQQEQILNPIPQFGQFEQPIPQQEQIVAPTPEPFSGGMSPVEPMLNTMLEQPTPPPMVNEVPLFGGQPSLNNMVEQSENFSIPQQPTMDIPNMYNNNINMNQQPENSFTPQLMDEPLFNPSAVISPVEPMQENTFDTPLVAPQPFEVPVVSEPVTLEELIVQSTVSKLQELQNLLSTNGYEYKLYGNDTTDCIIIELPRN